MDLKSYIESEVAEEARAHATSKPVSRAAHGGGYPGAADVYVSDSEVDVARLRLSDSDVEQLVYLARPSAGKPAPGVLVIHENKGLTPYIENVARRLAQHGYVAMAPDLLSGAGGTSAFDQPAHATAALAEIPAEDIVANVRRVLTQLADRDDVCSDRLGIVGFCYGGGVAWRVLTQEPRLRAGVPFYGPIPELTAVPGIQASVLALYGESDERITAMLPAIEDAMTRHEKRFEAMVLPGAAHAFHNDANPDRYNDVAAHAAWARALDWLDRWLKGA